MSENQIWLISHNSHLIFISQLIMSLLLKSPTHFIADMIVGDYTFEKIILVKY